MAIPTFSPHLYATFYRKKLTSYVKGYSRYLSFYTKNLTVLPDLTVWTNNKAFKYGASDSPLCYRCGETETMEHLLYLCPNYSEPLWSEASTTLTTTITHHTQEYTA